MKTKEITKEYLEEYNNDIEIIKAIIKQEFVFDYDFTWQDLKEEIDAIKNAEDLEKFIERRLYYSTKDKRKVIGYCIFNTYEGADILDIDYDNMKISYRVSGTKDIIETDIIEHNDGKYIDALGFMWKNEFIAIRDMIEV